MGALYISALPSLVVDTVSSGPSYRHNGTQLGLVRPLTADDDGRPQSPTSPFSGGTLRDAEDDEFKLVLFCSVSASMMPHCL